MSGLSSGVNRPLAANGPFLKTAFVVWLLGVIGGIMVLPYVASLEPKAIAAAAARYHIAPYQVMALSIAQTAVFLAVAVVVGLWAARKVGLGTPLLAALFSRNPAPKHTGWTLLLAVVAGVTTALLIIALDRFVFAPIPSVAELTNNARGSGGHPVAWQGFLASFYGAFDEEILLRLGVLSLFALVFRTLARMGGMDRKAALPSAVFWAANVVAAVLFGLGHLPATAALAPLTPALVLRAVVLNGTAGLVFGALYRRFGLEWAMASHFAADIVLHVAFA